MEIGLDWFANRRVTVMGLGLHGGGLGIAKWLLRRGAALTVTDLKDRKQLAKSLAELERQYRLCRERPPFGVRPRRPVYRLGEHREADFRNADLVIRNPAVPRENRLLALAERHGAWVETDISLFFHLCPFPIAAVTGTKGKTTVTALLAEICRRHDRRTAVGGNIRISPMDSLDRLLRLAERSGSGRPPVVLELSSWQLESLEKHGLSPRVAVITNIMRDHLNRYGGRMAGYAAAKELIVRFQDKQGTAVLNADDRRLARIADRLERRPGGPSVIRFSARPVQRGEACFVRAGRICLRRNGQTQSVLPVSQVRLPGAHNLPNVLAAVATAAAIGVPLRTVAAAVRRFGGVPGRLETVATRAGVAYVNDTTATTPDASIAALRAFSQASRPSVVLIAGGADKDLRFSEWTRAVGQLAKGLILLEGTATPKMTAALKRAGVKLPIQRAESMAEAVRLARDLAQSGDYVILSPGCASFGLFVNEFDRGDRFTAAVRRLR